jgi:gamma-tubulin complex component 4
LEFRVADFERFVDTVRETASRHLHSLVLVNADLRHELDVLRSFYLLGRGELFQTFIEEVDPYLQTPPTIATEYGIILAATNFSQTRLKILSFIKPREKNVQTV